jgi:hypothetical protein
MWRKPVYAKAAETRYAAVARSATSVSGAAGTRCGGTTGAVRVASSWPQRPGSRLDAEAGALSWQPWPAAFFGGQWRWQAQT